MSGLTQFFPSEDSGDNGQEQNVPQQIDLTEDDDEDEPVADPTDIEIGNEITSKMIPGLTFLECHLGPYQPSMMGFIPLKLGVEFCIFDSVLFLLKFIVLFNKIHGLFDFKTS